MAMRLPRASKVCEKSPARWSGVGTVISNCTSHSARWGSGVDMYRGDHALTAGFFNGCRKQHIQTPTLITSSLDLSALNPVIHRIPRDPESGCHIGDRELPIRARRRWRGKSVGKTKPAHGGQIER